jgi:hypothetical protein
VLDEVSKEATEVVLFKNFSDLDPGNIFIIKKEVENQLKNCPMQEKLPKLLQNFISRKVFKSFYCEMIRNNGWQVTSQSWKVLKRLVSSWFLKELLFLLENRLSQYWKPSHKRKTVVRKLG